MEICAILLHCLSAIMLSEIKTGLEKKEPLHHRDPLPSDIEWDVCYVIVKYARQHLQ